MRNVIKTAIAIIAAILSFIFSREAFSEVVAKKYFVNVKKYYIFVVL